MHEKSVRFSIILPCYNEAENLPQLLESYRKVWEALPGELILVDNGSTDNTTEILDDLLGRPEYFFARKVVIENNQGYGHGIYTGLCSAKGEFIGYSHADMQCDPGDLFRAYKKLISSEYPEKTLVKGKRTSRRGLVPFVITIGMSFIASVVLVKRMTEINAQPKVFHRSYLENLIEPPDGFEFDLYVLYKAMKARIRVLSIFVRFEKRAHGESKWASTFKSRFRMIWSTIQHIFALRTGRVK